MYVKVTLYGCKEFDTKRPGTSVYPTEYTNTFFARNQFIITLCGPESGVRSTPSGVPGCR